MVDEREKADRRWPWGGAVLIGQVVLVQSQPAPWDAANRV
jgi:hypothetical protein